MAKVGSWSTTPGSNNSTPPDGWPEGQAPSTVNDCAREMMAQIRTFLNDAQYIDQNLTPTFINTTSFSVAGNQTSAIHAGRRLKIFDATAGVATTIYATVVTASFTTVTTVSISADGGQLTSSLSSFAIAILSNTNDSLPRKLAASYSAITTDNLTINGTTTASGAVSLLTTLSVSGATALNSTLTVSGATSLLTTLSVSGATVLKGALSVGGAVNFGTTFTASGAVTLNTTLTVSGATTLLTTLTVGGATILSGAATLGTTLSVSGATVLKGTLSVGGAVIVAGATQLAGTLSVSGTVVAANVAKAWVRFLGSAGGAPTIYSSFNVASVSRSATGVYRVTFTNAFVDANYLFHTTNTNSSRIISESVLAASFKCTFAADGGTAVEGLFSNMIFYR